MRVRIIGSSVYGSMGDEVRGTIVGEAVIPDRNCVLVELDKQFHAYTEGRRLYITVVIADRANLEIIEESS